MQCSGAIHTQTLVHQLLKPALPCREEVADAAAAGAAAAPGAVTTVEEVEDDDEEWEDDDEEGDGDEEDDGQYADLDVDQFYCQDVVFKNFPQGEGLPMEASHKLSQMSHDDCKIMLAIDALLMDLDGVCTHELLLMQAG